MADWTAIQTTTWALLYMHGRQLCSCYFSRYVCVYLPSVLLRHTRQFKRGDASCPALLVRVCHSLTSLPCTMMWCVVISALKTTTQLALPALSISVSAIWGTFTLVSWVAVIRSERRNKRSVHVYYLYCRDDEDKPESDRLNVVKL